MAGQVGNLQRTGESLSSYRALYNPEQVSKPACGEATGHAFSTEISLSKELECVPGDAEADGNRTSHHPPFISAALIRWLPEFAGSSVGLTRLRKGSQKVKLHRFPGLENERIRD